MDSPTKKRFSFLYYDWQKKRPLKWQKILTCGPWKRVYGCCQQRGVSFQCGIPDLHRDQAIVERFDRTLHKRLSGFHIAREMGLPSGQRPTEWVVAMTSLTGKIPAVAVKAKTVAQNPSSLVAGHPVGLEEKELPSGVGVRYIYQPGKLEGVCRRATEPVCSLQVNRLRRAVPKHGEPVLYYLLEGRLEAFSGRMCMWYF